MKTSAEYGVPSSFYEEFEDFNIGSAFRRQVTEGDICRLLKALDQGAKENEMQKILEQTPEVWLGTMRTGHGNWVIPKARLGIHYVTDFLVAEGNSHGLTWRCVEIECPSDRPFNKDGSFSGALRRAVEQILDWRSWIEQNFDSARKAKSVHGHGFHSISPSLFGEIIIGRRQSLPEKFRQRCKTLLDQQHITVMSFDRLLERLENQVLRFTHPRPKTGELIRALRDDAR